MLRQTHTHQRESLHLPLTLRRRISLRARPAHATIPLRLVLRPPILRLLPYPHPSRPSIIPDPEDFDHIASLEVEFICGSRLVGPERANDVGGMDLVLGVVILEEGELFAQPEQSDDEYPRWHRDPVPNRLAVRTRIRSEHALTREQLHGSMPPSHELGDYEIRERPMSMMA